MVLNRSTRLFRECLPARLALRLSVGYLILIATQFNATHGASSFIPLPNRSQAFDFAQQISPLLAKLGCSAAECHGGATGQGGFKLSLFAENPQLDYQAIVQELGGRRLDFNTPSLSLFLRKPSRDGVKHKGGRLLSKKDPEYRQFVDWIDKGAPFRSGDPGRLLSIQLRINDGRITVIGTFGKKSKTEQWDITNLAQLSSSDDSLITVASNGQFEFKGSGQAWIFARYGNLTARTSLIKPFSRGDFQPHSQHPLDLVWYEQLRALGLTPIERASSLTLARRLYLDLVGRPPSPFELDQFANLPENDQIRNTADTLIDSSAFDDHFAVHMASFFEVPEAAKDSRNASARNQRLRQFFRQALQDRLPLTQIASRILLDPENQQAWKHYSDPRDRAEYIGRTMMGLRLGCARCHNHPLDRWTNEEHLRFSAFFTDPRPGERGSMMAGRLFNPNSGSEISPAFLPFSESNVQKDNLPPTTETVARLLLDQQLDIFERNMANRLFGVLLGSPLVSLTDDHRITNPAIHEPLLVNLTAYLRDHKGDVRAFVKYLVSSEIYALSSRPMNAETTTEDPEKRYLARRAPRSLTPGQFIKSVEAVIGVSMPSTPPPESPLARQLFVMNSGLIRNALDLPGNQIEAIFDFETDPKTQVLELYRLILSRNPSPAEMASFQPILEQSEEPIHAGKNLAFALIASREFSSLR